VNTWKVILATLVIFAAGVVTGGLLVNYADRTRQKPHRAWTREAASRRVDGKPSAAGPRDPGAREPYASLRTPGGLPKVLRLDFLQNLDRELDLTVEQREQIEKIITDGQDRNRQLWNRVLPEMRREMQETRERIRAVLRPDQVRRFEELMKQRPARKAEESLLQPDRRLRDPSRRPWSPPDGAPRPSPPPPAEPPASP
jgi:hypothetical protein